MIDILELRKLTGLSQGKFAKKYHINIKTLQSWEQGVNKVPEHYLYALNELLKYEGYFYDSSSTK
jgi:putative transcriptional regulator